MLRLVSLAGILVLLALCWAASSNRKAISWRLVGMAMLAQLVLGGVFLYWDAGNAFLRAFGDGVKDFLGLSTKGAEFVFGKLGTGASLDVKLPEAAGTALAPDVSLGFVFATQVLPTLIFFSAFMAVLYHLGVMQLVVRLMAVVTSRLLGTSGAESLSACANVFVGQTEAPLLVRPFLAKMTQSEIHAVMTGGFATIAGGVFALYVGFGIDAGHLMVASVMAVPAGLVCSKLLHPETEEPLTRGTVRVPEDRSAGNVVEAAANGAIDGLKLALNVGAMLIAFLGLIAVADWLLALASRPLQAMSILSADAVLSLDRILGWLFAPIAAVMGVPAGEITTLAQLLGKKIVATELVAYGDLARMKDQLSPRTVLIASFALCGFANLGSVAIQIGGLGAIAPDRKTDIARLAFRAMFAGAIATCMTACLAGVLTA
ncbi:MAG: NupC/NupG family nucleoside CNT transporter [Planctomycetes bacterium]|nr:NupC/NupG family nucleoside CNT transporter [Planctomycetota bacterium]